MQAFWFGNGLEMLCIVLLVAALAHKLFYFIDMFTAVLVLLLVDVLMMPLASVVVVTIIRALPMLTQILVVCLFPSFFGNGFFGANLRTEYCACL